MVLKGSIFSRALKMETGITVVGPNAFEPGRPYRVAYLLHGLSGSSGDWVNYTLLPRYADAHDALIVMPEVGRSFYADMRFGPKAFSYVADELPEICKTLFNIVSTREGTAVIGGSMGGYGAMKCALLRPERFGVCGALAAGPVFMNDYLTALKIEREVGKFTGYGETVIDDFRAVFGDDLEELPGTDLMEIARNFESACEKPRIYSACGIDDMLRDSNAALRDELRRLGFDVTYEQWPGNHDWPFFDAALAKALDFCFPVVEDAEIPNAAE